MKSISDRIAEIKLIYEKLNGLGLNNGICPDIQKFKDVANIFVKDGLSSSGAIKLQDIDRELVYILSNKSHITSSVMLKYLKPK
jgi:hypothetical protein